ncbi:MAG: class I SAM-dependent methyltransferase [Clostridium sp.]|jgi:ubiquinone/menaquinone biosynthesis C-methylase UbiE|nr:class I SAM-dependent methyltransferase [Clostridium sp.]
MAKNSRSLFNTIAPVYNLFFTYQRKRFIETFAEIKPGFDISQFKTALDVGCGTGALCSVLNEMGMKVTGVDLARKMLDYAKRKKENEGVQFLVANALEGLPFQDHSFELVMASYVAHGMPQEQRKTLYSEMSRISSKKVIIYDYNENRSLMTSLVEWLERGDYFHFIRHAKTEMKECMDEMEKCFSKVEIINVGKRGALYICTPVKKRE